jgi:hypothetical protein
VGDSKQGSEGYRGRTARVLSAASRVMKFSGFQSLKVLRQT